MQHQAGTTTSYGAFAQRYKRLNYCSHYYFLNLYLLSFVGEYYFNKGSVMNILKIGLIAAVLWQGHVYAGIEAEDNEFPQPAVVQQLCEGIIANGNSVLKYMDGGAPGAMTNTFGIGSNGWYAFKDVNRILEDIVVHPSILPFLKYRYDARNISGVELSCGANARISDGVLQKAISLLPSATYINIPMRKLPYPTPKPWKNNLTALSAPGLKHVRRRAFAGDCDNYYRIISIDLPSAESIGEEAFSSCQYSCSVQFSNLLKFVGPRAFCYSRLTTVDIPASVHFLSEGSFENYDDVYYLCCLSVSDNLRNIQDAFTCAPLSKMTITCHSRTNNIRGLLEALYESDRDYQFWRFKKINIIFDSSIAKVVNKEYITDILSLNAEDNQLLSSCTEQNGHILLDFSNIEMSKNDICSISTESNLPWVLSLPHIATVDTSFNDLFKSIRGVILAKTESIEAAFDGCSDNMRSLGFIDTCAFEGTPLADLEPSILELTVTQPQNVHRFLSALEVAGLGLSSVEQIIIKFPAEVAQSANLGPSVASLLAVLPPPPPQISQGIQHFQVLTTLFTSI
jgi:hypothetical protein